MKIDGLSHPKTKELAYTLGVPLPHAIGMLELMWAFVGQQTPRGNIGKWSNAVIAGEAGWDKEPDAFIQALIEVGFLDENDEHRLIVHDWSEHAPNWVHAKLKKKNIPIIRTDLRGDLRKPEDGGQEDTKEGATNVAKPNEGKPSEESRSPADADDRFDEFWEIWPRKEGKKPAQDKWKSKKLDKHADAIIADVKRRVAKPNEWNEKDFIPHPKTYLNQERWTDEDDTVFPDEAGVLALYAEILPDHPPVDPGLWAEDGEGPALLYDRWNDHQAHQSLDFWRSFFEVAATIPYVNGQNDEQRKYGLVSLLKPNTFKSVTRRWQEQAA